VNRRTVSAYYLKPVFPTESMVASTGILDLVHITSGVRDSAASFPLAVVVDDEGERRQANRAVGVSAVGLTLTGFIELAIALVTGSVALLGDALHNLSDVSTSLAVFIGFRASRKKATNRYTYGYERAEDLAGVGIAVIIWASAVFAGYESIHKLIHDSGTRDVGWGVGAAAVGIIGNQIVARYKLRVGTRINSATLVADAKHSWLDALSSGGAMVGLIAVLAGVPWADAVAGIIVTGFICHVGWEVTADVAHRLLDGVEPEVIETAEKVASDVPGVLHAHARARWTGRTLRVEVEGWVDARTTVAESDRIGQSVADLLAPQLPEMRSFAWTSRGC
jgi:cation diffusion facilitator family transporter